MQDTAIGEDNFRETEENKVQKFEFPLNKRVRLVTAVASKEIGRKT
jgi:hypothetical protein